MMNTTVYRTCCATKMGWLNSTTPGYDYDSPVQAGEGSFVTGGKMVGAIDSGPGEKRAKSIVGGKTTNLHAGDYFLVAADDAPPDVRSQGPAAPLYRLQISQVALSQNK